MGNRGDTFSSEFCVERNGVKPEAENFHRQLCSFVQPLNDNYSPVKKLSQSLSAYENSVRSTTTTRQTLKSPPQAFLLQLNSRPDFGAFCRLIVERCLGELVLGR